MPIDRIGFTEKPAIARHYVVKPRPQSSQIEPDTISLTKAARKNAEIRRISEIAMSAPDIRTDKLNELRDRIQDPAYPDQNVINGLADRLLGS
ncbi:MAG: flagellar biosynthesis anti-sigma factor FlgM [Spirochaetota bacterium]